MNFNNLKARTKILIATGLPLALMVLLSIVSIGSINSIVATEERVIHTQFVLGSAADIVRSAVDMETGMRGFLLAGKEDFLDPYKRGEVDVFKGIENLQKTVDDNPLQVARLEDVTKLLRKWQSEVAVPTIALRRSIGDGKTMDDLADLVGEARGKKYFDAFRDLMASFTDEERRLMEIRQADKLENIDSTYLAIIIGLAAALIIGFTLASMIGNAIARPISRITNIVQNLAEGDMRGSISFDNRHDEIGILSRSVNNLVGTMNAAADQADVISSGNFTTIISPRGQYDRLGDALQRMTEILGNVAQVAGRLSDGDTSQKVTEQGEGDLLARSINTMVDQIDGFTAASEKQAWISDGLLAISGIGRSELDMQGLGREMCRYLASYLQVPILTFYVAEDGKLNLRGSYAADQSITMAEAIEFGEGLTGQAALGKEIISVEDIPDNYLRVNSSLGKSDPAFIYVVPFVSGDSVLGVMELGLFSELPERSRDLLEALREPVAIMIRSSLEQATTRELLEETQTQAEELEAQSEELQTTNDELEIRNDQLQNQQAELELRTTEIDEKADALKKSTEYKTQFFSNMSHELRTPLNSLLLLAQSLGQNTTGNLTDKQVEHVNIIYGSGVELLELIDEILDLSKVEANQMSVLAEPISLSELSGYLTSTFGPQMENRGIDFAISLSDALPKTIVSDQQRLRQVLKNLLSNALKFTREGSISVSIDPHKSSEHQVDQIRICVTDTGIGIAADKQRLIFEAFSQADGSTSREYGGTGLGLSISQEFARLLGGYLTLESVEGEGATFSLFLPLAIASSVADTTRLPDSKSSNRELMLAAGKEDVLSDYPVAVMADDRDDVSKGKRDKPVILVVEDDRKFAEILRDQCMAMDMSCLIATTGEEGLDLVDSHTPDGIVLDIFLPGMNGWTVLHQLKENTATRHIPVHVVSSSENIGNAEEIGALSFLRKPIAKDQLTDKLNHIQAFISKTVKNLLVVEDHEATLTAVLDLIGNGDVICRGVRTGQAAVEALRQGDFDCMVLDLTLPDMDGFAVLENLKQAAIKIPPTVVYTAKDLTRDEHERLMEVAQSIVLKSARSEERLLDETSLFLHRVINKLPADRQSAIGKLYDNELALRDKTVLLVDDDMRNVFSLSHILAEQGMKTVIAENGELAIDTLAKDPAIDLVLMDMMMPVMDGYEAISIIRQTADFDRLPIIALTAKAMAEDRQKCLDVGADDYLTKPLDVDVLLSKMRIWLYQ
jgi:signal transduction histidine kinase/DNA-binding response OmpR family regulator/CHASE3 domain sensor protein